MLNDPCTTIPVHLKCFINNPFFPPFHFFFLAWCHSLLTHCFVTKLMSTLISAQKAIKTLPQFIIYSVCVFFFFFHEIYLITLFLCCLISSFCSKVLNLLRFYYQPDFLVIKTKFLIITKKRLFPYECC